MMDFLRSILPKQGLYFAVEKGEKGFIHTACYTLDELANKLAEIDARERDTYFACASYERESYTDETGKTRQRTAENALRTRSVWFDLDVGPDKAAKGKGYATVKEAWDALRAFCEKYILPVPTVVLSGGGIHGYWLLSEDIAKEKWLVVAHKLKALMKVGPSPLLADPARTADIASILRPVGTTNRKPERKGAKVTLVYKGEPSAFAEFSDAIDAAHRQHCQASLAEIPAHSQGREPRVTGLGTEMVVPPLETVRQALKALDPDMERGKWWPCIAALGSDYGEQGRALAREWSSGALRGSPSAKYDAVDFEKQFTDAVARKNLPGPKVSVASILYMARDAGWAGGPAAAAGSIVAAGPNWLNEMNEEYSWIEAESQIFRLAYGKFIAKSDFLNNFANKSVPVETAQGSKLVNKGKAWLEHGKRREHRRIVMRPGEPEVTSDNCLNTWSGFAVEAEAGDIAPFLRVLVRLVPDKADLLNMSGISAHETIQVT